MILNIICPHYFNNLHIFLRKTKADIFLKKMASNNTCNALAIVLLLFVTILSILNFSEPMLSSLLHPPKVLYSRKSPLLKIPSGEPTKDPKFEVDLTEIIANMENGECHDISWFSFYYPCIILQYA